VNLPNVLSLSRAVLAVPLFLLVRQGRFELALAVLALALATDLLDGAIARRWDLSTELGRVLDPVADKILVGSVLAALALSARVPRELAVFVVLRDAVLVALAWVRFRADGFVPRATVVGKVAFAVLGVYLLGVVVGISWPLWVAALVGALYVAAGFGYASRISGVSFGRVLKEE